MSHLRIRQGGGVRRYHTRPTIGEQTVASHSWGVAMIICDLTDGCAEPSFKLMRAALSHDLAEYDTGDTPATAKWRSADLKSALDRLEALVEQEIGIAGSTGEGLTMQEYALLKLADMLELMWFCAEQITLGNRSMWQIFQNGERWLTTTWGERHATHVNGAHLSNMKSMLAELNTIIDAADAPLREQGDNHG